MNRYFISGGMEVEKAHLDIAVQPYLDQVSGFTGLEVSLRPFDG